MFIVEKGLCDAMPMNEELNQTHIVHMNDFIFDGYLKLYPNLQGLSVKNNLLLYQENGVVLASEILTFDLRVLPYEARMATPKEFVKIIRNNKLCRALVNFEQILNLTPMEQASTPNLENNIKNYMRLYFNMKEIFHTLTEDNKILISQIDNLIASLPLDTIIGTIVNRELDEYYEHTKENGTEMEKTLARTLKNLPATQSLIQEEPVQPKKSGFINIAILIYGMVNIGIIVAIAFMK